MMRMTIGVVFAAALTVSSAAQDFMAQPGVPAAVFPKPDRPVADIVSPIWHTEKERDDADEPGQLVRLLGIKSGMTVADIGAGSGYYVDCRRSSDQTAASSSKISCLCRIADIGSGRRRPDDGVTRCAGRSPRHSTEISSR
jgi:hypothetical protein